MVGLAWEQHIAFLESHESAAAIERRIRDGVRECAGHPALFALAIGNEIPSTVVRWYGHRKIEKYLHRLYLAAMEEDPCALITYGNYPSTEYLELPFLDFLSFNVFLESPAKFSSYLARLQTMAGDRPLVMSEVGLDAKCHGESAQAKALHWQVKRAFRGGCAGLFVFSWTDQWHRGGEDITEWEFGLTDRSRRRKPALSTVAMAMNLLPIKPRKYAPGISVIVCTYNGSANLRWCLEGLCELEYPNFEVIVIDDGSTDESATIAAEFADRNVRVIRTPNQGLSAARNCGLSAAHNDIIAYIDDDARPDPHWLTYLADSFSRTEHAGIGGPNIPPPDAPITSRAVALSPGGPVHVLLTDELAEHIPGCNMAFRRQCLLDVEGFDPRFRIAGDDVDLCWRLEERGWTLGFNPGAMVLHKRRNTIGGYWKQQLNYGRAEADLERKWPQKYNAVGHLTWAGRLYRSNGLTDAVSWWARRRIYHGTWGSAMFQSVYHAPPSWIWSVPAMPEWYLLVFLLGAIGALGLFWPPLYAALALCALASVAPVWHAIVAAHRTLAAHRRSLCIDKRVRAITVILHLIQPIARLCGRIGRGLTPWRFRTVSGFKLPRRRTFIAWNEALAKWQSHDTRLKQIEIELARLGVIVARGGDFDRWDLELRTGTLGALRMRLLVEEHGGARQFARLKVWPCWSGRGAVLALVLGSVAALAGANHAPIPAIVFAVAGLAIGVRMYFETGLASWAISLIAQAGGTPVERMSSMPSAEMVDPAAGLEDLEVAGKMP
jgi:GT2 family glycosyltransferase